MSDMILLVEDDPFLREGLSELFEREGYNVTAAANAKEAAAAILAASYSLIVLDVSLPDGNGIALCKTWRGDGLRTPILFLTALDDEVQIVRGLDAGGNDYVTKPFRMQELLSRIRALLRRNEPDRITASDIAVDMERMTVHKGDEAIYLTPTEFKILSMLLRNQNQIVTRTQLLELIWDADEQFIDDNTLSVHVRRLREKTGIDHIRTVRGVGYKWESQL